MDISHTICCFGRSLDGIYYMLCIREYCKNDLKYCEKHLTCLGVHIAHEGLH